MNQKVSVTGLQNIGKLMERNAAAIAKPVYKIDVQHAIVQKTVGNMPNHLDPCAPRTVEHVRKLIEAAVREAFNAGHAESLAQSNAVDALLDKQYKARTNLTMPAVVAAVMEQTGMHRLALALDQVATVFDRCKIEYAVDMADADTLGGDVIHYTLEILPTTSDRAVEGP